jgi:hypothetical protein
MKEEKEIDCDFTDEIVCPYCGQEQGDSWAIIPRESDDGETNCGNCDKLFYFNIHREITYSSHK